MQGFPSLELCVHPLKWAVETRDKELVSKFVGLFKYGLFLVRLCLIYALAFVWRLALIRTTFIAITGSVGKTTAKECLKTILAARFSTVATFRNQNDDLGVPRTLLRIRPWHRIAVVEIGIDRPPLMKRSARLVRPHVAVILAVKRTHTKHFRTLEECAEAKSQLLRWLRPGGVAILNGDDARVAKMADRTAGTVRTFGTSSAFDLWADHVSARWPGRLRFRAHSGNASHEVATQLVGAHWLPSVLGALAAADVCGVPLQEACELVRRVEPFAARLQPVRVPGGAIVLRDENNSSADVLEASLRVLEDADADRRILVISDISDVRKNRAERLKLIGRAAARTTDFLVVIGRHAEIGARAAIRAGMHPDHALHFESPEQAAQALRCEIRAGDLVLLKGRTTHHITRVFFALLGHIDCWKRHCTKRILCDHCPELGADPEDRRKARVVSSPT